ncbi:MAG: SGNH/GDSL hydrolase family protein [Cyanobacteria bacterium P01_A01_bin.83]
MIETNSNPSLTDVEDLGSDNSQLDSIELPAFERLYVFSDSLADPGNIFNTTKVLQLFGDALDLDTPITPVSPPYFEGRFTNGLVWVEQLAAELDIDLTPSTELSVVFPGSEIDFPLTVSLEDEPNLEVSPYFDGNTTDQSINFAFGGAQTGEGGSGELGDLVPGIQEQVEWFVDDHQLFEQTADSDALYIVAGGTNDYSDPSVNPEDVVNNLKSEIQSLYDIGARDFLVPNLSDLGELPATPAELADSLTNLTEVHNGLLEQTVNELNDSLTGAEIAILDLDFLFDDVLENPSDYGFTNVSDPYLDPATLTPTVGADVDEYLFFDEVHPTVAGHEIINDFVLTTLAAEF